MAVVTKEQLENAALDAQTLEAVVNGTAGDSPVESRLGVELKTLAKLEEENEVNIVEAHDWAVKTDGIVDSDGFTDDYSAKEYAVGTQASTGGSAKNWAQQTGADVTGAPAGSRSAKEYAQGTLAGATNGGSSKEWAQASGVIDGGTGLSSKSYAQADLTPSGGNAGGSSKDWAISSNLPDGTNKSAKSYAADASAAATLAASTTPASVVQAAAEAGGATGGMNNPNLWPDPTLLNSSFLTLSPTGSTNGTITYIHNRGNPAVKVTNGAGKSLIATSDIASLGLVAGQPASFGVMLDEKNTTTNTHFTMTIQEYDATPTLLATTTVNGPTGNIITGTTPVYSMPQPVVAENVTLNAATVSVTITFAFSGTSTTVISRPFIRYGARAFFSDSLKGRAWHDTESPNLWKDGAMLDMSKMVAATTGTGSNQITTYNGQRCLEVVSTGNRQISIDTAYTDLGLTAGTDRYSFGFWVDYVVPGSTAQITLYQANAGNSNTGGTVGTYNIPGSTTKFPLFVPVENILSSASATKLRMNIGGGNGMTVRLSRFSVTRGPRLTTKRPNDVWTLNFRRAIMCDFKNAIIRFPDVDLQKNGYTKRTFSGSALDPTNTLEVIKPLSTGSGTPYSYYFDIAAAIAGTDPYVAVSGGNDSLDLTGKIYIGTSNGYAFHSPYYTVSDYNSVQNNEFPNANLSGGVAGTGVTVTAGAIAATSTADLNNIGILNSVTLAPSSGVYTPGFRQSIADIPLGSPIVIGLFVYSSDANWDFTGGGAPAGPGYFIRQNDTATVKNTSMTNFIKITNNLRLYYYEDSIISTLAAGKTLLDITVRLSVPSAHTNTYEISGPIFSTKCRHIMQVDWLNWTRSLSNDRTLNTRLTSAESSIATNTSQIATNTAAIASFSGAATTTTANLLVPKYINLVSGREGTFYTDNILDTRNVPMNARRMHFHSEDANYKPYSMAFADSVSIDPSKVGTSGFFGLQSIGDTDILKTKNVTIRVSGTTKSNSPVLLCLGDSVTAGSMQTKLKTKLTALGISSTFVGTQSNNLTSPDRGEGRSGWRFYYWTGWNYSFGSPAIPKLNVGSEASYMASPDPNVNPFLRASVGGDPAGSIFNGLIFDPAFYQSRFNAVTPGYIPTPTHVIIAMGVNDVNSTTVALSTVARDLPIMVTQLKTAWPSVKIGIIAPIIGNTTTANDATHYTGANGIIAVRKKILELFDTTVVANVEVLPLWMQLDTDVDFPNANSVSTDSQTGQVTGTKSDYLHPTTAGHAKYTEATLAWLMNNLT